MHHYVKFAIIMAFFSTVFISDNSSAKSAELIPIKPRIVGGEVANQGDWPWVSALVFTFNSISTTLVVDSINYESQAFSGGVAGSATGNIVDCGIGETQCADATDKICLIERGAIDFSVKAESCEAGGGIGAIIYNNEEGAISGTLGDNFTGTIPVVSVTQADGATLKTNIGAISSLTVSEAPSLAQSSTCGASFLGDKWLLTAAHCVVDISPQQVKVNVGEYDLSNGAENAKAIKRFYIHPDYQLNGDLNNDIALIELIDSVNNPAISLVDLTETEQFSIQNSAVTVVGWGGRQGYEANGGPTSNFPDVLHQVDLQLITNDECKNIIAQSSTAAFEGTFTANNTSITEAMICAYIPAGGKGACQGDSGGPLMIETNRGWQQIGIVSWGIGCAAQGFPGVYTRSGLFSDWVNKITQGIAINQVLDFTIQAIATPQSATLEVINNSDLNANLTFTINGDANFTMANNDCDSLAARATCLLQVNYDAAQVGEHSASLIITSDNNQIATSSTKISAQTIALASEIKAQLSSSDDALTWYSGSSDGNSAWQLDNTQAAIVSGDISHNEKSIVMVTASGEGELSFEWSVSSEENIDDPDEPYDALYLYVDGELIDFISGDINDNSYESKTVNFSAGEHNIVWIYEKDAADKKDSTGEDNAHIRNVVFTPINVVTPTPTVPATPAPTVPASTNSEASSSSGGSIVWWSLIFMTIISLRRK